MRGCNVDSCPGVVNLRQVRDAFVQFKREGVDSAMYPHLPSSFLSIGITDYSRVNILGAWNKTTNFEAREFPSSIYSRTDSGQVRRCVLLIWGGRTTGVPHS